MLGKLLWCMIAGRLRLPREYRKRPGFNLTEMFPNNQDMHIVNCILDRCVVEEPRDCLESAQQLLPIVDENLAILQRGSHQLRRQTRMVSHGQLRRGRAPDQRPSQQQTSLPHRGGDLQAPATQIANSQRHRKRLGVCGSQTPRPADDRAERPSLRVKESRREDRDSPYLAPTAALVGNHALPGRCAD